MFTLSRRDALASAALGAAFGLSGPLRFISTASAAPLEPLVGFHKFKVGSVEVTAIYDGIWRKPHDPAFIKNASVEETKDALAKAGLTTDFMPIPLTVFVLKIGDKLIMCDAGSGVGQWQANATNLPANMKAAGIDHKQDRHGPDLAFPSRPRLGTDGKGHQRAAVFPNAELDRQCHRIQLVDGPEPGREAGRRPAWRQASASPTSSRPGRTGGWWRTAPRWRRAFGLSPHPATRPAIRS